MKEKANYISERGLQNLVEERDQLVKVERPKVTEVVAWAASLGDRSENADYQYGKKRLREIDRRVRFLNQRINDAVVIKLSDKRNGTIISFGAVVEVEFDDGEEKTFTIVGIDETDSRKNWISWRSPIAKSLLGKKVDDEVIVRSPAGERELTILSIKYEGFL